MQSRRCAASQQRQQAAASNYEASQPPSDVWIKVGLLSSCLHNNNQDRSSAAVPARASDYLASGHTLENGSGSVPVQVSAQKCWAKTGPFTWWNAPKSVSDCAPLLCLPVFSCPSPALQIVCLSFPPGAYCHELQPEPVNWTNSNCHRLFVDGWLQGTGSLTMTLCENLGQMGAGSVVSD